MSTTLLDQHAVVAAAVAGGACADCARLVLAIVAGAAATVPDDALLTGREQAVLVLLERGLTAAQIGRRLGISAATVRKHLEHVYAKLGVHDRLSATLDARRRGLLLVDVDVTVVTAH